MAVYGKPIEDDQLDPDRIYRSFGLAKTRIDRSQEYTKIEGEI